MIFQALSMNFWDSTFVLWLLTKISITYECSPKGLCVIEILVNVLQYTLHDGFWLAHAEGNGSNFFRCVQDIT